MEPKTVGGNGGINPPESTVIAGGLPAGAIIMTLDGEKPIEDLRPGDRIVTRDAGMVVLKRLQHTTLRTRIIRIKAGSLGHTRPERDVYVPETQGILVRDWRAEALFGKKQAMVPAAKLVDGEFITDIGRGDLTLYHLTFDAPHVIYADGLEMACGSMAVPMSKAA